MSERFVEYVPVDEIDSAPRNPKGHDATGISRSIGHFGLTELPLIDERTGRLVAGHGRRDQLASWQREGRTPPEGVQVDHDGRWLMPVVRGWRSRSDDDAEAYVIASNQLTIKGGWDERQLAEVLHDLGEAQMLELAGYEAGDLDALEALANAQVESAGKSDEQVLGETDEAGWPVIRAQVAPELYQRWKLVEGDDDAARVAALLDAAGY